MKNISAGVYHSIELVEYYHGLVYQIYSIITTKIPGIKSKQALQMSFKALNDWKRTNSLVPIFLLFVAYLYMIDINAFLSIINQRNITICKVIEEVRRSHISCQVNDILNIQKSLFTTLIYNLFLNSLVLVFCEGNTN